jgi:FSR family fosmidomycin resistance protein-like MFS transporter
VLRNLSHGANDIYWFVLPPVLPLILQEFGLRYTAAGGIVAAYLCMTAVASMIMGSWSDRIGRLHLIGFGFLLASVALWAGALMPRLPLVISCIVIGGIGVSTYHPAAYASIDDAGLANGRTYGLFEASGALAVMVMLVLHGIFVSSIGWRGVIAVGAVPGAIVGLLILLVPGASFGAQAAKASPTRVDAPGTAQASMALSTLFIVGVMLRVLGVNAVQSFLPTYLVRSVHLDTGIASFGMGLWFLGGAVGATVMGRFADRRGAFLSFLIASGLFLPLMPILGLRLPIAAYPVLLLLFGFACSGCFPPQNMILTVLNVDRAKGQVFGLLMGLTTLTSSVSPLLFGVLADGAGLRTAITVSALPVAAGWIVTIVVWQKWTRQKAQWRKESQC